MAKRVFFFLVILLLNINLFAQQDFSLSKYFVANPMVGAAIDFNQPGDMIRVEKYVKSLIQTGNFNFPDIYGSNLTPYPNEWASYPDSVLWNVYYTYAAFSIYMDYTNRVPWKLSDLTGEQLKDFFYTEYMFNSHFKNFGSASTPTNPIFTYSFLIENNLIGKTRKETMERLFQWSRYKLQHFVGSPSPENFVAHWQHNDGPPVERVITGTTLTDNGEFSHWSRGCVGATMFFANVLRVINIPVKPISIGTHVGMDFPSESLIMTHGDDPYGIMDEMNDIEIHAKEIFVPYAEIDSLKALGVEGNDIVSYGSHKVVAKHFPLWYFHPTDTNITYTRFSNALQYYTRSDTTQQYYQIMDQARARYSSVDVDRYLVISNLKWSDSLWYKKVYGLNPNAYLDTVLITNDIGYARVINNEVHVFVDEATTAISPVFIRNADSFINIEPDSSLNLNNTNLVTVSAEDSTLMVTYSIIKNSLPRYSVTLSQSPEGAGVCAGDGLYLQGTNATIIAAPANGLRFVKWTEADTLVSLNSSYTFTPENDRSFVAHFDTLEYTIAATIEPEAGGTVDGVGIYKHGSTVELTAIPADGYQFVGWKKWMFDYYYYISYEPTINFVAEQDTTLIAEFAINWYLVVTNASPADGGTLSGEGWYPHGTQVTVTATPHDDWIFLNWVKWTEEGTDTLSANPEFSFVLENRIYLIANFTKEYTLNVTVNPKEGGIVSGSGTYFAGSYASITATPFEGYRLVNYTDDDNPHWLCWGQTCSIYVDKDRNLTANFTKRVYSIYAYPNSYEAGSISGAGDYEFGDMVELVATPNSGYDFVNWTENGNEVSANLTFSFTATAHRNLTANFVIQTHTIAATASPIEGGYITGDGFFDHNSTVNLVAYPNTGYHFVNWTEDETEVSTYNAYSFTAIADRNLVANFAIQSHTINAVANPVEGGSLTGAGSFNHGATVNLVASPNEGYDFVNWSEGGTNVSTYEAFSFSATTDRNLVANFTIQSHTINAVASPVEGGSITGAGSFNHGATVNLVASPNEGYDFVNWSEGGTEVSTNGTYSFTATANRNLVAYFAIQSHTINAVANPVEGGSITGAGSFNHGATVNLVASPIEGYDFVNWAESGTEVSTNRTYSFIATADKNLVANFSPINSIIIVSGNKYNLKVYPNPAKNILTINFSGNENINSKLIKINLYNSVGKIVKEYNYYSSQGVLQIPVSDIPTGLYVIDVQVNNISIGKGKVMIIK